MLHEVLSPALWLLLCLLHYLLFVWLSFFLSQLSSFLDMNLPIFLYVHIYLHINSFNYDLRVNNHQSLDCLQNSKPMFSSACWAFLCDSTMSKFETAVPFFPPPLSFPLPPSWIYFFYYWCPISQTYQLWVSFHSSLSMEHFHLISNLSTIGNPTIVCIICSCLPVLEDPFLD